MLRPSLKYSLVSAFTKQPDLPTFEGEALVFGSAPDPILPRETEPETKLVSVNASQASLDRFFDDPPDFTFMRSNFVRNRQVDTEMVSALANRRTKRLFLVCTEGLNKTQEVLSAQLAPNLKILGEAGYLFDACTLLSNAQRHLVINQAVEGRRRALKSRKVTSMGVFAAAACLHMGARRVTIAGISLNQSGHSYSGSALPRAHVTRDQQVLRLLAKRYGNRIVSTDASLCELTGVQPYDGPVRTD